MHLQYFSALLNLLRFSSTAPVWLPNSARIKSHEFWQQSCCKSSICWQCSFLQVIKLKSHVTWWVLIDYPINRKFFSFISNFKCIRNSSFSEVWHLTTLNFIKTKKSLIVEQLNAFTYRCDSKKKDLYVSDSTNISFRIEAEHNLGMKNEFIRISMSSICYTHQE